MRSEIKATQPKEVGWEEHGGAYTEYIDGEWVGEGGLFTPLFCCLGRPRPAHYPSFPSAKKLEMDLETRSLTQRVSLERETQIEKKRVRSKSLSVRPICFI